MSQPATEYLTELEEKTYFYLGLIKRIDTVLEGPVMTIIRIVDDYDKQCASAVKADAGGASGGRKRHVGFPVWMSEDVQPEPGDDLFSKSLCLATIQEVKRLERRFSWLKKGQKRLEKLTRPTEEAEAAQKDGEEAVSRLISCLINDDGASPVQDESDSKIDPRFTRLVRRLSSRSFGALNPLTSSQVFQVLINDGERQAHGAVGFLSFFAMIWPLYRRFPDPQRFGAAIEPWEPKAYVTAKCLLPIKTLQDICAERAELLDEIGQILTELEKKTGEEHRYDPYGHWLFCAEVERLRARLLRLSRIVVARNIRDRANELRKISDDMSHEFGLEGQGAGDGHPKRPDLALYFAKIMKVVGDSLTNIGEKGKKVLGEPRRKVEGRAISVKEGAHLPPDTDASTLLSCIEKYIVSPLEAVTKALKAITEGDIPEEDVLKVRLEIEEQIDNFKKGLGLKLAGEFLEHRKLAMRAEYVQDLCKAARTSLEFCDKAQEILYDACDACAKVRPAGEGEYAAEDLNAIRSAAQKLAEANRRVAKEMDRLVREATVWCRNVVDREIAHASARNATDFDPSELVSGIAVAVKWNQMTTTRQVSDAVSKALAGVRDDGSWSPGQPFYSPNNAVGIWPVTSDTVLSLTSVLGEHQDVQVADEVLFRYVDWLELTKTELKYPDVGGGSEGRGAQTAFGWASDRLRNRRKIHFPTTAFSVQALLKIRDLIEYRLWQLCEKRFTVIPSDADGDLKSVDPVDLGAKHAHRLHRHLSWMAEAQGRNSERADYSLVLHGPPGSSKTAIAKAFSVEMWNATRPWGSTEAARLLRITPADFTRLGEDRLDSEARLIFSLISGIRGVTILFDEIDDLLRQRNTDLGPKAPKPTFMELVVPAMLNRLADLREVCPRQEICFLLATNFVDSIEPALIRKGRIDQAFPVVYPDYESRIAVISNFTSGMKKYLKDELGLNDALARGYMLNFTLRFAESLAGWPYLTIKSSCRRAQQKLTGTLPKGLKEEEWRATREQLRGKNREERKEIIRVKQEERSRVESIAEKCISDVIAEGTSSFIKPDYTNRLLGPDNTGVRRRPEILNEYAHYIISILRNRAEWEKIIRGEHVNDALREAIQKDIPECPDLLAKVEAIIAEQERRGLQASES